MSDRQFKVGDKVRVLDCDCSEGIVKIGSVGTIRRIDGEENHNVIVAREDGETEQFTYDELQLVTQEGETMSELNIAQEIRNHNLTDTQRKLREAGLVDSSGIITQAGKDALWALLVSDKEDILVSTIDKVRKAAREVEA